MISKIIPSDILIEIFKYLQLTEVHQLKFLSKQSNKLFTSAIFLQALLQKILNTSDLFHIVGKDHQVQWYKNLNAVFQQKVRQLPFWGQSTNGGICENQLRFWIGKTFIKSQSPNVILNSGKNSYITGRLASNYYQFLDNLLIAAKYQNTELDCQIFPQQQLDILNTFMGCFHYNTVSYMEDQDDLNQFSHARAALLQYVRVTSKDIQQQRDLNDIRINSKKLNKIGCLFSFEVSRNLHYPNPIQKILILSAISPLMLQSQSSIRNLLISEGTFMREYSFITDTTKDCVSESQHVAVYTLFRRNPLNIIAYIDMQNCKTVNVVLPIELRRWTNQLCMLLVEGRSSSPNASSISIQYCSARGLLIDTVQ